METSKIVYTGELRTKAEHIRSGNTLITDAPLDNQGRGEFFSPTDLLATSLGSCMLTIMGITARTHGIELEGTTLSVKKIMASNPRRVSEIVISFDFNGRSFSDKEQRILKAAAESCPVSQSLHSDCIQRILYNF